MGFMGQGFIKSIFLLCFRFASSCTTLSVRFPKAILLKYQLQTKQKTFVGKKKDPIVEYLNAVIALLCKHLGNEGCKEGV